MAHARPVLPSFVEATSHGVRGTDPCSTLFEGRIVFLGTPIDAATAAAILLNAGAPGHRSVVPNARVSIHQPSIDVVRGRASDLEIHADIERDLVLTADEAVAYGLVDNAIASREPAR